jgi:hypothetical protein
MLTLVQLKFDRMEVKFTKAVALDVRNARIASRLLRNMANVSCVVSRIGCERGLLVPAVLSLFIAASLSPS